jgi:hypothetical protein
VPATGAGGPASASEVNQTSRTFVVTVRRRMQQDAAPCNNILSANQQVEEKK